MVRGVARESPQTREEEPERVEPTPLRERLRRADSGGSGGGGYSVGELLLVKVLRTSL